MWACELASVYNNISLNTESWEAPRRAKDAHGRSTEHELSSALTVMNGIFYRTSGCNTTPRDESTW